MKRLFLLLFIGIVICSNSCGQVTKRVLFLGNSYTYYNDMPQIIADMARSTGDSLYFDSYTPGGYNLEGHSTNTAAINKIKLGNWDYVVLQEQSQRTSEPISQVQIEVFPSVHKLDSIIDKYNPCAETILYMTWGRKNGDASRCDTWPPVCTYQGMDSLVYIRYMMLADSNNAIVSPVGAVWREVRKSYPSIELYNEDESHPSEAGSYVSACALYTTIFRKDPSLIDFNSTLSELDAANILFTAKSIIFENLRKWHIGEYDPEPVFSYGISVGRVVQFNNASNNASTYSWDFGDEYISSDINPIHTYNDNGVYNVVLTAINNCNKIKKLETTIEIGEISSKSDTDIKGLTLYPNPIKNDLIIVGENIINIMVYDYKGEVHHLPYINNYTYVIADFTGFSMGIYFLVIKKEGGTFTQKVLKQ